MAHPCSEPPVLADRGLGAAVEEVTLPLAALARSVGVRYAVLAMTGYLIRGVNLRTRVSGALGR